jgi:hypothetical protein
MPDYILSKDITTNTWQRIPEQPLQNEDELQQLVNQNPEVLPLDDLADDAPPLFIVAREARLDNGNVDVIGVDWDGLITIIECKLDRNPEVKRKVIGQILGYAAYLWGMTYEKFEQDIARVYFDSNLCPRRDFQGVALDEAMERFVQERKEQTPEDEWSRVAFRQSLADNLRDGRFRLLIVVDKVNDELRRTVEYLNACTAPNFQVLCAELRYFSTKHTRLLVPALIGKPPINRLSSQQSAKSMWTLEQFMTDLQDRAGEEAVRVASQLHEWCSQNLSAIKWGSGVTVGQFYGIINKDSSATPFFVRSDGKMEIAFQYLKAYPPFNEEATRRQWLSMFSEEVGLNLPGIEGRPSIPLTTLSGENEYQQFIKVVRWAVNEIRAAH